MRAGHLLKVAQDQTWLLYMTSVKLKNTPEQKTPHISEMVDTVKRCVWTENIAL